MDSTKPSPARVTMPFNQAKIDSQMDQLTLAEKVSLLGGSGFATTTGVSRLGIESMKVQNSLISRASDSIDIKKANTTRIDHRGSQWC